MSHACFKRLLAAHLKFLFNKYIYIIYVVVPNY